MTDPLRKIVIEYARMIEQRSHKQGKDGLYVPSFGLARDSGTGDTLTDSLIDQLIEEGVLSVLDADMDGNALVVTTRET